MTEETITNHQPIPVIGIDLGGTQLRIAVLQGEKLLARTSIAVGKNTLPDHIIPQIYLEITRMLDEVSMDISQTGGIGIGIAGPLDSRTGVVFTSPNLPGWHNIPLRDILEEHYGIPIFVENDGNTAALGEYMFGAGKGYKDIIYLTVSTGIGSGIIINGQIVQGVSGTAGELGHITIDRHGERCNCGNIGCLESIASGTAIARRANNAIASGIFFRKTDKIDQSSAPSSLDAKYVAEAARAGVQIAQEIISDAAEALGIGLVNIIHIFNPEIIILGGGVIEMGSQLLEPALRIVQERTMDIPCRAAQIVLARLGANTGLLGAAALVYLNAKGNHIGNNRLLYAQKQYNS